MTNYFYHIYEKYSYFLTVKYIKPAIGSSYACFDIQKKFGIKSASSVSHLYNSFSISVRTSIRA